jgi:hypothetical protein
LKRIFVILIQRGVGAGDVAQPELFIGLDLIEVVPKVKNLGFFAEQELDARPCKIHFF